MTPSFVHSLSSFVSSNKLTSPTAVSRIDEEPNVSSNKHLAHQSQYDRDGLQHDLEPADQQRHQHDHNSDSRAMCESNPSECANEVITNDQTHNAIKFKDALHHANNQTNDIDRNAFNADLKVNDVVAVNTNSSDDQSMQVNQSLRFQPPTHSPITITNTNTNVQGQLNIINNTNTNSNNPNNTKNTFNVDTNNTHKSHNTLQFSSNAASAHHTRSASSIISSSSSSSVSQFGSSSLNKSYGLAKPASKIKANEDPLNLIRLKLLEQDE
jgi:hypothetical protein